MCAKFQTNISKTDGLNCLCTLRQTDEHGSNDSARYVAHLFYIDTLEGL